ncbi:MAG TPA: PqqD family peptide modification chaperone [Thermoanaerobaculia bacterium]
MEAKIERPKKIEGLLVQQTEGALLLTHPTSGATLLTNRVGARILDLADGTRTVPMIVDALSTQYPAIEREKISRQVDAFVTDGVGKGIVQWAEVQARGARLPVLAEPQLAAPSPAPVNQEAEQHRKFHPDVYWYLTFRCNLACKHCSVQSSPWVDNSGDLDTAGCLRVIDQMQEMQIDTALLSGGEVLIRPDALQILRALGDKGISIGLETNGLRFDRAFVELARELQERNLLIMTISVDGGTQETHEFLRGAHSFGRTVRGLRFLAENGIHFDVQCVLNNQNFETIPQLYDLASELHPYWGSVILSSLNAAGRGSELIQRIGLHYENIPRIFDLIHENKGRFPGVSLIKLPPAMVPPKYLLSIYKGIDVGCSTSCKFPLLGILPNGDITVCALGREETDLFFGNVREVHLKDAWQKARMDLLRTRYVTGEHLKGICADCVWKKTCKGSCRAWAYVEGEDFESAYPVCQDAADKGLFPDEYRISKRGERSWAPVPQGI